MSILGESHQRIILKGPEESVEYFTHILKQIKDKGGR
jgi:hypothetical protein